MSPRDPADPRALARVKEAGGGVSPLGDSLLGGRLGRGVPRGETTAGGKRRDLCPRAFPRPGRAGVTAPSKAQCLTCWRRESPRRAPRARAASRRGARSRAVPSSLTRCSLRAVPQALFRTCCSRPRKGASCLSSRSGSRAFSPVLHLARAQAREAPARRGLRPRSAGPAKRGKRAETTDRSSSPAPLLTRALLQPPRVRARSSAAPSRRRWWRSPTVDCATAAPPGEWQHAQPSASRC